MKIDEPDTPYHYPLKVDDEGLDNIENFSITPIYSPEKVSKSPSKEELKELDNDLLDIQNKINDKRNQLDLQKTPEKGINDDEKFAAKRNDHYKVPNLKALLKQNNNLGEDGDL